MRYFSYNEPIWGAEDDRDEHGYRRMYGNRVVTMSEEEIRREYFPRWEAQIIAKVGAETYAATYGFAECLEDWIILHWAWEVID